MWVSSSLRLPSMPMEMSPSAVTANDRVMVAPSRMNGSSPPAALATAARIVSMASTSAGVQGCLSYSRPRGFCGRSEVDLNLVCVAPGHLAADFDLHADERQAEVQASSDGSGSQRVQGQGDGPHPQVTVHIRRGDVRFLDGEFDSRDHVRHGDALVRYLHGLILGSVVGW